MRIIHTSDWHIGRRFKGMDLSEYQRAALDWLIGLIQRERVDVLCVSGDLYDLPRPSNESVRLFSGAFERLGRAEVNGRPLQIVFTPGNHDSAARLGFGAGLMQPNVHMRCDIDRITEPVLVAAGGETLAIYAVPYLDPDTARPQLQQLLDDAGAGAGGRPVDGEARRWTIPRSHEGMMRAALTLITADLAARRAQCPDMRAILMAHAFVSGADVSDSERSISVGGIDSVPAALFSHSGLDYLALGHLHRPQRVSIPDLPAGDAVFGLDRTPQARYSGSLLAYSFSERCTPPVAGNGKSVVLLETAGLDEPMRMRTVPVESGEPAFVQLEGSVDQMLGPLAERHGNDWVSLTIHAAEFPHGIYQKLDARYRHALEKHFVYERTGREGGARMANLRRSVDEMDVLSGFVRYQLNRDPDDDERRVLERALEEVRGRGSEYAGTGDADDIAGKER